MLKSLVAFAILTVLAIPVQADDAGNLELIKSSYDPPPGGIMLVVDPNVLWIEMEGGPYGGVYKGAEQVGALLKRVDTEWEGFHPIPQEFIDGGDKIAVSGMYQGVNKHTGKKLEAAFTHAFTLKGGKIVKLVQYTDTHKFREAMK